MSPRDTLTRNQSKVLDRLKAEAAPLSAYALLDRLRDDGFRAPLQVYRALDGLIGAGYVHRLESMNAFVACCEPHDHAHGMIAFAICDQCGQVAEFSDHEIGHRLDDWVRTGGFVPKRAVIEFRGTCAGCAGAAL